MGDEASGRGRAARECPKCGALVPAGHGRCLVCRLERSQMDEVERELGPARRRAEARAQAGPAWWKSRWALGLMALLVLAALIVAFIPGKPARGWWLDYPAGKSEAVRSFLSMVSTGSDVDLKDAYKILAPSVKHPKDGEDEAKYAQVFTELTKYLTGEFGPDWQKEVKVEESSDESNLMLAHVGAETLHIRVENETPVKVAGPARYGIVGVDEFDVADAAGFQQMEGTLGAMRMLGASKGQVAQLSSVLAAGHPRHETRMQTKVRLLPTLRNPRLLSRRVLLETWIVRKDPVIRRRLQMIMDDGRYEQATRDSAKAVLQDNVPEEELVAIGTVPDAPG